MYLVSYIWVPTVVFIEGMIEGKLWDYQFNGSKIDLNPKKLSSKLITSYTQSENINSYNICWTKSQINIRNYAVPPS